jgi:hypothetical protein
MNAWDRLSEELDAWATAGQMAEFWWRDDDAIDATPALDRLLAIRRDLDVPLALAVIPANARPALPAMLGGEAGIDLLQHGYAHINHRPPDEKKAELQADRELWDIARELADGRGRMIDLFGDDGWQDVMVPPWNRIEDSVTALLPGLGYQGLTTFGARAHAEAVAGLSVVNTHVDIIDWINTRSYAGDDAVIGAAVDHLSAKRVGRSDAAEATGVLTHHLAHDDACWGFIERFGRITTGHSAAIWRSAHDLFAPQL